MTHGTIVDGNDFWEDVIAAEKEIIRHWRRYGHRYGYWNDSNYPSAGSNCYSQLGDAGSSTDSSPDLDEITNVVQPSNIASEDLMNTAKVLWRWGYGYFCSLYI